MVYTIKNTGNQIMPFSYGGHDSFALTKPVEDHYLLFEKEEEFTALLQEEDGALNGKTMSFGRGTKLDLDNPLLKDDLSLLLKGYRPSREPLYERYHNVSCICSIPSQIQFQFSYSNSKKRCKIPSTIFAFSRRAMELGFSIRPLHGSLIS